MRQYKLFLLIVMVISFFMLIIPSGTSWLGRVGYRLLLLPVVAGVSYEIIKFAGRHDNLLTKLFPPRTVASASYHTRA